MNQKQNKALRLIESVFITFNTLKYVQGSFWNLSYFQVDAWVYNSFMAGRACGQYEANPVYWLANWALSCLWDCLLWYRTKEKYMKRTYKVHNIWYLLM